MGLFCIVRGSFLISAEYQQLKNAQESLNWPTTEGVIISSKIKKSQDDNSTIYDAHVRYKYAVGNKHYLSERVSFGRYK